VALYDLHLSAAQSLKEKLSVSPVGSRIVIEENVNIALSNYRYILEATPSAETIPDELICDHMVVAAPGVPLGISDNGCQLLNRRLVHDKLELGVAAMAISLLL
jgi:pyrrolysine biosynthesis protein PylD